MLKKYIRSLLRKVLGCKEKETVKDCICRRRAHFRRYIYRGKYGDEVLIKMLKSIGISEGDNLIVHCSWREFFGYTGSPERFIDILLQIIGPNGNLAMPCYGDSLFYFDVDKSQSAAGVLSEVFRLKYPVLRSECSHFSMAVLGPNAGKLCSEHNKSTNGFDKYSPYAKFGELPNSKILLLGLGKKPSKFSLIHVCEYKMREDSEYCKSIFDLKYDATVVRLINGERLENIRTMVLWSSVGKLNAKEIAKIYKNIDHYAAIKYKNLTMAVADYKESEIYILSALKNGAKFTI